MAPLRVTTVVKSLLGSSGRLRHVAAFAAGRSSLGVRVTLLRAAHVAFRALVAWRTSKLAPFHLVAGLFQRACNLVRQSRCRCHGQNRRLCREKGQPPVLECCTDLIGCNVFQGGEQTSSLICRNVLERLV